MGKKKKRVRVERYSEVWNLFFTDEERAMLRKALHRPDILRTTPEQELVRKYWRLMKRRSRDGMSRIDNKRNNKAYHEWLRARGYAERPFNRQRWEQWRREGATT